MDCSCFSVLVAYAVTVSISFAILVGLYTSCSSTQEIVSGNQENNVVAKYDILSIDNSEMTDKAADTCNCFMALGFTMLEMLVIIVLGFGLIVGIFRMATYLKETMIKKQESKKTIELGKEQEMRKQIENEIQRTAARSADVAGIARVTNTYTSRDTGKLEFP